ncbi:MAG: hypothetical protein ACREFC_11280 [Stellaceae bacterium]
MARSATRLLVVLTLLAFAGAARAADGIMPGNPTRGDLTPADLAWLRDHLNLPADSPAVIDLTAAQKVRLHDLVADGKSGADRKRQAIVTFLAGAAGGSMEDTLDRARQPSAPSPEIGENRSR